MKGWEGVPHALEGGLNQEGQDLEKAVEASRQQVGVKGPPSTDSNEERELAAVLEASRVAEVARQQQEIDDKWAMDVSGIILVASMIR